MMIHFFFFNDTATTEIYTLSLHDALPICRLVALAVRQRAGEDRQLAVGVEAQLHALVEDAGVVDVIRSEEHTSELQSQSNLGCRLLLEKKRTTMYIQPQ